MTDDAFISLRYAKRWLAGSGLTWTDGVAVEGYSNLLWVLFAGGLGAFGMDLVLAVRVLGVLFAFVALGAVVRAFAGDRRGDAAAVLLAPGIVALSPSMGAWTIGGLETPLVVACLAVAWGALWPRGRELPGRRQEEVASLALGLLVLTRPDGPLFVAIAAAWLALAEGRPSRASLLRGARLASIPILCFLGQLAFRLHYYGDWVPNTARVKISPSGKHFEDGMAYLGRFALAAWPAVLAGVGAIAAVVLPRHWMPSLNRRGVLLVGASALAWGWYLCWIGGDIFPAFRHGVPLVLALAYLSAELLRAAVRSQKRNGSGVAVACALLVLHAAAGWMSEENRKPRAERWEWDSAVAGRLLKEAFGAQAPLLAVDAAGALPYYSELPALDMLGLNDAYLARNRPEEFGKRRIGHELGDGRYVFERRPDLVAVGYDLRRDAYEHGAKELQSLPEFHREYRWCRFEGNDPYRFAFGLWVRHAGGRVGVRREDGRIAVPAHLFSDDAHPAALSRDGNLVVRVDDAAVESPPIPIDPGVWTAVVDGSATCSVELLREDGSALSMSEEGAWNVSEPVVRIRVRGDGTALVRGVKLLTGTE